MTSGCSVVAVYTQGTSVFKHLAHQLRFLCELVEEFVALCLLVQSEHEAWGAGACFQL